MLVRLYINYCDIYIQIHEESKCTEFNKTVIKTHHNNKSKLINYFKICYNWWNKKGCNEYVLHATVAWPTSLHPWEFLPLQECLQKDNFKIVEGCHMLYRKGDGACAGCHQRIAYPMFPIVLRAVVVEFNIHFKTPLLLLQDGNMALACYPLERGPWRQWRTFSEVYPRICLIWKRQNFETSGRF